MMSKITKSGRITIIHNPIAGFNQPSVVGFIKDLESKGYEVIYCYTGFNFYEQILSSLEDPGDVVVIAGGDGTVKEAGEFLIDTNIPIAVIPIGSANNIARVFGIKNFPYQQIMHYTQLDRKILDVGSAKNVWGEKHFLESTGMGLLAFMMEEVKKLKMPGSSPFEHFHDKMIYSLELLKRLATEYPSKKAFINIDGKVISGSFVFAEAMNIAYMGPKLNLAPEALPDDQLLDLVLLRDEDRGEFKRYIEKIIKGEERRLKLPVYKGRKVIITWPGSDIHIDGKIFPSDEKPIIIEGGMGRLEFLIPESSGKGPS